MIPKPTIPTVSASGRPALSRLRFGQLRLIVEMERTGSIRQPARSAGGGAQEGAFEYAAAGTGERMKLGGGSGLIARSTGH